MKHIAHCTRSLDRFSGLESMDVLYTLVVSLELTRLHSFETVHMLIFER